MELITKFQLLETNYVIDNEYLDKYVSLINAHRNDPRVVRKTHSHHIIPVSYYTSNNLDANNSKSNLVNLQYKDHMLAHLYLSGCTKGRDKYKNLYAVFQLSHFDREGYLDIQNYDKYEQIYTEAISAAPNHRKGTKCSEQTIQRMKDAQRLRMQTRGPIQLGRVRVHDDVEETVIDKDQLDEYLSKGYVQGRKYKHSPETIAKQAAKVRGQKRSKEFCDAISYRMNEYYKAHSGGMKGKHLSPEQIAKCGAAQKGRKTVNNGQIYKRIRPEELDKYLAEGWELGKGNSFHLSDEAKSLIGTKNTKNRGRKHIHKGDVIKAVTLDELSYYLSEGWELGRPTNFKKGSNEHE